MTSTLSQPHINYQYWQWPPRNTLPPVSFVQWQQSSYAHQQMGTRFTFENSLGAWPGDTQFNCRNGYECERPSLLPLDRYGSGSRWVDVSSGGNRNLSFTASSTSPWLHFDPADGTIAADGSTDIRVRISVDWDQFDSMLRARSGWQQIFQPPSSPRASIVASAEFTSSAGDRFDLAVPIKDQRIEEEDFAGFVEGDGLIAIEVAHFQRNMTARDHNITFAWVEHEFFGKTLSGVEVFPVSDHNFTVGNGPVLEYDFYTFSTYHTVNVTIQTGPMFNYLFGKSLVLGVSIDEAEITTVSPIPAAAAGQHPEDWVDVTTTEIRSTLLSLPLSGSGAHTIRIWGMTSGVVLERILLDFGGIEQRGFAYLGPPESIIL